MSDFLKSHEQFAFAFDKSKCEMLLFDKRSLNINNASIFFKDTKS